MKVADIFNKLIGLNPETDYNFVLEERGKGQETQQNQNAPEPPTPPQKQQQQQQLPTNPIPQPEFVSRETFQATEAKLSQALTEINNLKQMNFALLTNTPAGNNEPSVDECIMGICMPNYKKGE